jgi:RNA polymerase sigma factor (sigma-70 family)
MTVTAVQEPRLPLAGRSPERELERLYGKHAQEVRRYVLIVLRNRNDTEDVVQQTFLKALRALQQGVRPERPRQWLVAIAHNECRMLFRRAARRPVEVELELAGEVGGRVEDGVSAEAIRQALGDLAPKQRAALVMRELDDRSYAEIAKALELTESAVETLLFRARRALREQLETAGGGCEDAQALIAADSLDDVSRKRLRAHVRTCHACATLEHRRRGKLAAAARKVASLFPVPSWLSSLFGGGAGGAKAVVAIAVTAVAATGSVEVAKMDAHKAKPAPAPLLVHQDAVRQTVASPALATPLNRLVPAAVARRKTAAVAKPSPGPAQAAAATTDPVATPQAPAADPTAAAPVAAETTPAPPATTAQDAAPTDRQRPEPPASLPPLPRVPPLPDLPPLPQVDPSSAAPALPNLPQTPSLPEPPPVPSIQVPAVPPVQTPTTPTLTKP